MEQTAHLWSIETVVPLTQLSPNDVLPVFHERFIARPEEEIARLLTWVGEGDVDTAIKRMARPSATSRPRGQAPPIDQWRRDLTARQTGSVLQVVQRFGLDRLYSDAPGPLSWAQHQSLP